MSERRAAVDSPPGADRRAQDRRRADRRGQHRDGDRDDTSRRGDDALLDALAGSDSALDAASYFDPGWLATGDTPTDSRFLLRQARRIVQAQDSALARVYRTYAAARAVIGVGLVGAQGVGTLMGSRNLEWITVVSLAYAAQAITLWLLPRFRPLFRPLAQAQTHVQAPMESSAAQTPAQAGTQARQQAPSPSPTQQRRQRQRQWLATIGIDIVAFIALHLLVVGNAFNYAALLVLPVLMAGVLTSRLLALGTAAAVSLLLLVGAWRESLNSDAATTLLLQSGLTGTGLFVIALVAGELAGRLAREEVAARGSLELARQQAQLNRLVIEEMADGVLVVDRRLRVRAANPAARALLVDQGLGPPAPFTLQQRPSWAALQQAAERALAGGDWPDGGSDVTLRFGDGHSRTLRMRVRFMRGRALDLGTAPGGDADAAGPAGEPFAVLLLEDVRTLQARIRQEKLAAMGRVSAGIAHEIRNPLAAIAQANALLMEDRLPPEQQRLAAMVADNVERLKRLIDDVMEVAPGAAPPVHAIDAAAAVGTAAADWARTAQIPLAPDSRLRAELPAAALGVLFDPEHLRRVLVNLLDNAQRHASTAPGAVFLRLAARDDGWAQLSVLSDGAPIAPEVERHLFEPFFSTRSRGSGLGLYICRELCERYGASIDYRPRLAAERLRNEFVVTMLRAALPRAQAAALPLQPP